MLWGVDNAIRKVDGKRKRLDEVTGMASVEPKRFQVTASKGELDTQ